IVVDAPVDDIDSLQAVRRPHVHAVVVHYQVAPLNQLDTHALGEEGVLEISRIIDAGTKQHHGGIESARRRDVLEYGEQGGRVVVGGAHVVRLEQQRKDALEHLPVMQHVADPGRSAGVVLQDEIASVPVADEIGAADVDVDVARYGGTHELAAEECPFIDETWIEDAIAEDQLIVINVLEK